MPPRSTKLLPKRRVGRPRKQAQATPGEDLREQIVAAAAELFRSRGIAQVSMQEIAHSVGLGTSSLYYWFRRKELIVAELVQRVNRLPIEHARTLSRAQVPLPMDAQLFALVRFDVLLICEFPLEISEVHRFSERDPDAFATYWQERAELVRAFARIVKSGSKAGLFRPVNPELCAHTIIAQDESVQNWRRKSLGGPTRSATELAVSAEAIAEHVASQTVGGLLMDNDAIERIKRRAAALNYSLTSTNANPS
jgi:TetR/AcrR family transcriptional regulator